MAQPSIRRNYIYNTLYEILAIISPLITAPYVSRIFGSDGVGIYSYTNAIAVYFTMIAALGIKSYGQREIAQHRDNKAETSRLSWELEIVCVTSTLVALLGWTVLILISKKYSVYYLVLTMTVLATAFDISWFWGGQEQFKFIVIRNSIVKILGIILLFTFVKKKSDLALYIGIIAGMNLLGNISMWSYLSKYLVKIDRKTLSFKRHYKQAFIYFVPTIATSIYTVLDKAMIGWITADENQNGYYEQATSIINMCKSMIFSVITVVSSRMSFLFSKEKHEEIRQKMTQTLSFVTMIAVPVTVGVIVVAKRFVPWFFGKGYDETVNIIYIMAPLVIIIGISNCFGSLYFTPSGQRARSNKAIVTGAVVNLCLNLIMIKLWKARGAASASLLAESTITFMYLFMARDYYDLKNIPKLIWKRAVSAGIMAASIIFIGNMMGSMSNIVVLVTQIISGALIYLVSLIVLRDDFLMENIKRYTSKIFGRKEA